MSNDLRCVWLNKKQRNLIRATLSISHPFFNGTETERLAHEISQILSNKDEDE